MTMKHISWQERYDLPETYTFACKLVDKPAMLAHVIATISKTGAQIGDIKTVGVNDNCKFRDITICCTEKQVQEIKDNLSHVDGLEIMGVVDETMEVHRGGLIDILSRYKIESLTDLRMVYTPGVAKSCLEIEKNPETAWDWTGIGNRVAIVTNGTAVLGLGDIGVVPSMPVMEGKSALFSEFAGISAVPILIDSKDPDVIVDTVCHIAASFGAIQLEDISAPACFEIEDKLRERLDIPVFHDDQHGTATVTLATLINGLKRVDKKPEDCRCLILGAGAAGYAIAQILLDFGIKDVVLYDSTGAIYQGRTRKMNKYKQRLADITNKENQQCNFEEAFVGKDIFIGVAKPNMVTQEMVASMNDKAIVLPLSNPIGEITVQDALAAGAAMAADGRRINNALAFPGLFRGALDAKASSITMAMQITAAKTLSALTPEGELLPDILNKDVHVAVAKAVKDCWLTLNA